MTALGSCLVSFFAVFACLGQGTIGFSNDGESLVTYTVGGKDPVEVGAARVELLWAPSGTPFVSWRGQPLVEWLAANPAWQELPSSTTPIGPLPGRFLGGTVVVPTPVPGDPVELFVIGWLGNYITFDQALGEGSTGAFSEPFSLQTGNPTTTPPGTPAIITGANGFTGLGFYVVPEPSSALVFLLGVAFLLFRNSKGTR